MPPTSDLKRIYRILDSFYGNLRWWPGKTRIEIIVGAILTQNTAWKNVEKAISCLRKNRLLTVNALRTISLPRLGKCIRPSGYYNQKSKKLKNFIHFLDSEYDGSLGKMAQEDAMALRSRLLTVNGIGPETADSIILYAFDKPVFVIDAYTRRIFSRLGFLRGNEPYDDIRAFFENRMPRDAGTYNQYHALIVNTGKDFCSKTGPDCRCCPLQRLRQCSHIHL